MFKNYFKTAFRNLTRNKSYAIINICGLAVGIAASLLIFLVIRFESSFDNFHKKKNSIYRLGTEFHSQDGVNHNGGLCFPAAPAIKLDFPEIKQIARIFKRGTQITIEENGKPVKKFNEGNFYFTEPEFFNIFDFNWIAGNPQSCLSDPTSAALTKTTAEKYFGNWQSALGKTIKYNNKDLYTVKGILDDIPVNTDFPLSIVVAFSALDRTYMKSNMNDWVSTFGNAYTFVVLPHELPPGTFNQRLKDFAKKHKPAEYALEVPIAQPLSEMHYDSEYGNYREHTFSHALNRALTLIGIFLIIIACVNFINLATAQAVNRSKEVGVRKVLGSNRRQLALQFIGETALISITAIAFAVAIAASVLPAVNQLLQIHMDMNFVRNPLLIVFVLVVTIMVTILSGLYPAIILSGFNPVMALKNRITSKMAGGISLRRVLVVFQFSIAHVLIIGMLIVVAQMDFFKNASLGFDKASIVSVPFPSDSIRKTKVNYVRDQLRANPAIQSVSFSYATPSSEDNWNSDFKYDHSAKVTDFSANLKWADAEYFKTYHLQFVAGHPYAESDTIREFVVNETLLRKLGIKDPKDAIGKELNFWNGVTVANIVGVVRDFNSFSLREPMAPVVLGTWKDVYQVINIKIKPGAEKSVLPVIEKLWNKSFPDFVYEYHFLDDTIKNFYAEENRLSILYKIFAGIAIFISCLGLYGLVSFMAARRIKEVGIRKVLGANAGQIVYLLSKEFSLLIIIAFAIAGPVAWFIMRDWLQNYSYRIHIGITVFLVAIIGSMLIAWVTVGHRAVKAALANPVKSLRTE